MFIKRLFILFFIIFLYGCGSSSGDKNTILYAGESIICKQTSSFTITPSKDEPEVTIVNNVSLESIEILVDNNSKGFIEIVGCIEN